MTLIPSHDKNTNSCLPFNGYDFMKHRINLELVRMKVKTNKTEEGKRMESE